MAEPFPTKINFLQREVEETASQKRAWDQFQQGKQAAENELRRKWELKICIDVILAERQQGWLQRLYSIIREKEITAW